MDLETSQRAGVLFIAYRNEVLEADHHLGDFAALIPLLGQLGSHPGL
ncbi:MAG: hypothetical protein GWO08_16070 [Gammaproteobacteria bacterium]|nr:hypothetical protein [Gammaproteobacteria bacterium]